MLSCQRARRGGVQVRQWALENAFAPLLPARFLLESPALAPPLPPPLAMAAAAPGATPGTTASAVGTRAYGSPAPGFSLARHCRNPTAVPCAQPSVLSVNHWNHRAGAESYRYAQEPSALSTAAWSQLHGRGNASSAPADKLAYTAHRQSLERNHQTQASQPRHQHLASAYTMQCTHPDRPQLVRGYHLRGASLACSSLAHQDAVGSASVADAGAGAGAGVYAERTSDAGAASLYLRDALGCCEAEKAPLRVAVLLSGGVDSSVALRLLHAAGHRCTAFYLKIWFQEDFRNSWEQCPWEEDLGYAQAVCDQIGVELRVVHLTEEYWSLVVSHCMGEIQSGRTPNPDMLCNSRVKFGAFFSHLDFKQFDRVASGHYARVVELHTLTGTPNGTPVSAPEGHQPSPPRTVALTLTKDPVKDQTYFLSHLSQQQLARVMFPLGALSKAEVREWATHLALPNCSRRDSQGICFLGKVKFGEFLAERIGEREGRILEAETGEELGRHRGFWFYTIGQRQGIRLSGGPWYVVSKDTERNVVFVSKTYYSADKNRRSFWVGRFSWLTPGADWAHHLPKVGSLQSQDQRGSSGGEERGQEHTTEGESSQRAGHSQVGGQVHMEGQSEVVGQGAATGSNDEAKEGSRKGGDGEAQPTGRGERLEGGEGVAGPPAGDATVAASARDIPSVDWSNVLVKVRHGPKLYRCAVEFLSHSDASHSDVRHSSHNDARHSDARHSESGRNGAGAHEDASAEGGDTSWRLARPAGQAMAMAQEVSTGKVIEAEFLEDFNARPEEGKGSDARPGEPWGASGTPEHSGTTRSALPQSDSMDSSAGSGTLRGTPGTPHEGPGGAPGSYAGGSSMPRKEALVRIEEDDQGLAAGQYAVFYAGDVCLGGAMILGMPEDGVRSAVSREAVLAAQRSEQEWEAVYESRKSKKKAKKAPLAAKVEAVDGAQRVAL